MLDDLVPCGVRFTYRSVGVGGLIGGPVGGGLNGIPSFLIFMLFFLVLLFFLLFTPPTSSGPLGFAFAFCCFFFLSEGAAVVITGSYERNDAGARDLPRVSSTEACACDMLNCLHTSQPVRWRAEQMYLT